MPRQSQFDAADEPLDPTLEVGVFGDGENYRTTVQSVADVALDNLPLATSTETIVGTDTTKVVTPAGLLASFVSRFDLLTNGESSFPRISISQSNSSGSGNLRLAFFTARKTETITQVVAFTGTTAAAATPTLCRIGIYSVAANGDLTLVASTANDTTLFASTSTAYTRTLSASWSKVAGTRYAIGALVVSGATMPMLIGTSVIVSAVAAGPPLISAAISGQTDLPASVLSASVTAGLSRPYMEMLP